MQEEQQQRLVILTTPSVGHFVVLIGYDPTDDMFIYRDPAAGDSYCVISANDLDRARQATGTDHDW